MKPGINLLLLISISFLFFNCANTEKKPKVPGGDPASNRQAPLRVDGYVIHTQTLSENVEVPGNIIANEATEIHPEISGRVVYLNVREGIYVAKGTVLARLYDGDLQAQLKKLQIQEKISEQKQQRLEQLVKIGGISQQDYDLSKLEVTNIHSDIDIVLANISRTVVKAPFAGKLGLKNISPGAYVTPAIVITTIQQTSQMKMDFTVPEKYTSQIKPGIIVNFTNQGSNKKYAAKVIATESSIAEATRSLTVRSLIQNKDADLLPGSFAKVILDFEPDTSAIMIPTQAVLPQARGKKVILYNGGVAQFKDVTTGIRDSSNVQITSGLKPGDTVIITGLLSVRPNSKIILNKIMQ